jgi:hypothetical protein
MAEDRELPPIVYGWAEIEGYSGPLGGPDGARTSWGICKDSPEGDVIKWAMMGGKAECKGFEHEDGEITKEPIRGKKIVGLYIPFFASKAWKEYPALENWTEGPLE